MAICISTSRARALPISCITQVDALEKAVDRQVKQCTPDRYRMSF